MNQAEIKAQQDAARIFRVTNPFDFEFTHAWGGIPYTLPVGKPLLFPMYLADHLATHLARQSLIRKAPMRDTTEIDGKGTDRPLWSDETIAALKSKIMVEEYREKIEAPVNEQEVLRRKVEELNKAFEDFKAEVGGNTPITSATDPETEPEDPEADANAPVTEPEPATGVVGDPATYVDKAEVIAALDKKGIKYDARASKAKLEELLK